MSLLSSYKLKWIAQRSTPGNLTCYVLRAGFVEVYGIIKELERPRNFSVEINALEMPP